MKTKGEQKHTSEEPLIHQRLPLLHLLMNAGVLIKLISWVSYTAKDKIPDQ